MKSKRIYGFLAEFKEPEKLVEIAQRAREAGYRRIDGFSPYPVEGLAEALGSHHTKVPVIALAGGLTGGLGGYFMLYSSAVAFYPINVANRPLHSWPMFIPITFLLMVNSRRMSAISLSAVSMEYLNESSCPSRIMINC